MQPWKQIYGRWRSSLTPCSSAFDPWSNGSAIHVRMRTIQCLGQGIVHCRCEHVSYGLSGSSFVGIHSRERHDRILGMCRDKAYHHGRA
jgi:hypothetical protein